MKKLDFPEEDDEATLELKGDTRGDEVSCELVDGWANIRPILMILFSYNFATKFTCFDFLSLDLPILALTGRITARGDT